MYLVKWTERDGTVKSIVADAWITEISIKQDLIEKGFNPTSRLIEEVLQSQNN